MFLHRISVACLQLQCSCNSAAAPHLQLNKKLSHAQPALPQPNMQENNIHIYSFAAHELSVAMLSCSCTAAAPPIAVRRQALPFRNSRKNWVSTSSAYFKPSCVCYTPSLPMEPLHPSHLACLPGACYLQVSEYKQCNSIRTQKPYNTSHQNMFFIVQVCF